MSRPAIVMQGLSKTFGSIRALDEIDLEIPEGMVLGLLGPNGAGKSTAIRVLATLLKPDAGRALVGGFDVVTQAGKVRKIIGLTGQYAAVDELLSGHENLYMLGRLIGLGPGRARERADELLETFDLTGAGGKIAREYSGGMRRRLDLAASLVGLPGILFLDEPTTGLDPRSRRRLWDFIGQLVGGGTTVLLTTQYLEEAEQLADSIVVIDHGRIIAAGTSAELKSTLGGQVIDVTPGDPQDNVAVRRILEQVALKGTAVHMDGQTLAVAVSGPEALWLVTQKLERSRIPVAQLALRQPSLDEVFLALTGHIADEAAHEQAAGAGVR
ncbi:MAG: ATP-binding cassette domain-containing protein [Actinomycetota bacterium]